MSHLIGLQGRNKVFNDKLLLVSTKYISHILIYRDRGGHIPLDLNIEEHWPIDSIIFEIEIQWLRMNCEGRHSSWKKRQGLPMWR